MNISSAQFSPNRKVLLFGKDANPTLFLQQKHLLDSATEGIKERDIKVEIIEITDAAVKKYQVDASKFTFILVGKDGGEKYRCNKLLSIQQLFGLVDAMPMRNAEMRRKLK